MPKVCSPDFFNLRMLDACLLGTLITDLRCEHGARFRRAALWAFTDDDPDDPHPLSFRAVCERQHVESEMFAKQLMRDLPPEKQELLEGMAAHPDWPAWKRDLRYFHLTGRDYPTSHDAAKMAAVRMRHATKKQTPVVVNRLPFALRVEAAAAKARLRPPQAEVQRCQ